MDLTKVKPSRNVLDRTNADLSKIDWTTQLGMRAFQNQNIPWGEGTAGLDPQALRELLFRKVLEEFSVNAMQDYSKWPHQNPIFPTIGPEGFRRTPFPVDRRQR